MVVSLFTIFVLVTFCLNGIELSRALFLTTFLEIAAYIAFLIFNWNPEAVVLG